MSALANRRGFLAAMGSLMIDPERLAWRPGAKLISIPPAKRVLLTYGDLFTIEGQFVQNPFTGEAASYVDPATGQQFRFRQRFIATEPITNYDGNREWMQKSMPDPQRWYSAVEDGEITSGVIDLAHTYTVPAGDGASHVFSWVKEFPQVLAVMDQLAVKVASVVSRECQCPSCRQPQLHRTVYAPLSEVAR